MDYAIKKLKQDEVVLMKKIKSLQDGKPKWAASEQLDEIRSAIQLLERYNNITEQDIENEDEYLKQIFELQPAKAKAQSDNLNRNKFSSNHKAYSMNSNSIDINIKVHSSMNSIIDSIDREKYNSIEREREQLMGDKKFIAWLRKYKVGSRIEVKDYRASELMQQYTNYPKWVASKQKQGKVFLFFIGFYFNYKELPLRDDPIAVGRAIGFFVLTR